MAYLKIEENVWTHTKTKQFTVFTFDKTINLGTIKFYPAWRKFVFFPCSATLFDINCLKEIYEKLQSETVHWRANILNGKSIPPSEVV